MADPGQTTVNAAAEVSPHLAHHFASAGQQFSAGKFGMWLFLATEILLFSGLFCVYAVYRGLHPEIFLKGHEYLDRNLGALNTVILLCSSFTMASAVNAAQRSRRTRLVLMLALTLLGGLGFLGVKAIEYQHKWKHHLLWGAHFRPAEADEGASGGLRPDSAGDRVAAPAARAAESASLPAQRADAAAATLPGASAQWEFEPAGSGPRGLLRGAHFSDADGRSLPGEVRNVHQFFAVYFAMTGLHGLHVVAGMVVIFWLLLRARRGDFGSAYYTPVDLGGLYWHLVDVIWIYLFPLLYLIH